VDALLANKQKALAFYNRVRDAGLMISAFSCHGNPIHPDPETARGFDQIFRKTVRLASLLGVPVVNTFSGCPGDNSAAKCPNWIIAPWPPEFSETLQWQWEKRVIPYWQEAGRFAADHGIKVGIEAHPGFVVYNVETALRLREAAGKSIGVNFDPSHLFWQGADIPVAIQKLGGAIFHFHAKDVVVNKDNVACNGVLDTKSYRQMAERAWLFRSVGWGHDALVWRKVMSALRLGGYDYVVSIEHEDALASVEEGVTLGVKFLSSMLLTEPPAEAWWT
jgi:sugar phosphate isomerase/epimerase